jgi:hypothetical protein
VSCINLTEKQSRLMAEKLQQFAKTTETTSGCFFLFPSKTTVKTKLQYTALFFWNIIYINTPSHIKLTLIAEKGLQFKKDLFQTL